MPISVMRLMITKLFSIFGLFIIIIFLINTQIPYNHVVFTFCLYSIGTPTFSILHGGIIYTVLRVYLSHSL